ncbi:MAG: ABC transporter ATP-binding protein [Oscillospiraceae bacterium]|jgi:iron complex transport system ATP-binding protein|nr:ABC transporter ATP-binding protein [Oscillospiraceae bacterium]
MGAARVDAHDLRCERVVSGYDGKAVVREVSVSLPGHGISAIIGPNACGKSTLLKTMARLIKPMSGAVTLDGRGVGTIKPKRLARMVGLLPQSPVVPDGIAVGDLVGRGRYPRQRVFRGWTKEDEAAVAEAMGIMSVAELADRSVSGLSGGQRQRVWIAMALAQQTDILLLDEPTTFLDVAYQIEILDVLSELNRERGITLAMVLHDINLAARYADYIFAMKDGRLAAEGKPREVVTAEAIKRVFGMDCVILEDPVARSPLMIPVGRRVGRQDDSGPASIMDASRGSLSAIR